MKKLLLIALILSTFIGHAQTGYPTDRNNGANQTQEKYLINSPGNMIGNSRVVQRIKDSTYYEFITAAIYARGLPNTLDQPGAINFLYTDANGMIKSSSLNRIYPDTNLVFPTFYYLDDNYYSKPESDMRYIQNVVIDSQMVVDAVGLSAWQRALNISYLNLTDTPFLPTYATNARVNDSLSAHRTLINGKLSVETDPLSWHLSDTGDVAKRTWVNGKVNDTASALRSAINSKQPQLSGTGFVKATGTTISYDNSTYLTSVPAQSFSSLTGKPTTLSGYGITDAKPLSYQPDSSIYQTVYRSDTMRTRINTALNGKEPTVTAGTTAQYYRGDKTWQTLPVAKRIEQYSGVTNASGQYAVTFPVAFSVAPVVQPSIPNQSATNMFFRVTSVSTTGFTVNIFQRASLNVLGLDLIAAATTNVATQAVDVSVFEK